MTVHHYLIFCNHGIVALNHQLALCLLAGVEAEIRGTGEELSGRGRVGEMGELFAIWLKKNKTP